MVRTRFYTKIWTNVVRSCGNLWPRPLIHMQITDVTRKSSSLTTTTTTTTCVLTLLIIDHHPLYYNYYIYFFLLCRYTRLFWKGRASYSLPKELLTKDRWLSIFLLTVAITGDDNIIIIINPLTVRVVGAPQMSLQPVFSIFPCSPLPSGTCRTPGLSIPWCCLPTSFFVHLVFFPLSLCLARWFWPDLMNGKHDHTTAVCVSLRWSGNLHVVRLPAGSWHGLPRW